jgi:hypothetical protein
MPEKSCPQCPYSNTCDCKDSKFDCYLPEEAKAKIAADSGLK